MSYFNIDNLMLMFFLFIAVCVSMSIKNVLSVKSTEQVIYSVLK